MQQFGNYTRRHRPPISGINIVPYLDVMLVLVVILMVTAPLVNQGVEVQLPQAESKALAVKTKLPIIVTVDKCGKYFLNLDLNPHNPLDLTSLQAKVAAHLQLDKDRIVLVRGDKAASYEQVLLAMSGLQKAGVEQISLETKICQLPVAKATGLQEPHVDQPK